MKEKKHARQQKGMETRYICYGYRNGIYCVEMFTQKEQAIRAMAEWHAWTGRTSTNWCNVMECSGYDIIDHTNYMNIK